MRNVPLSSIYFFRRSNDFTEIERNVRSYIGDDNDRAKRQQCYASACAKSRPVMTGKTGQSNTSAEKPDAAGVGSRKYRWETNLPHFCLTEHLYWNDSTASEEMFRPTICSLFPLDLTLTAVQRLLRSFRGRLPISQ